MDSRTGKKIRLGRLFDSVSQRSLIVAYSHGVLMGAMDGMNTLADMKQRVEAMRHANGLMITPGMVKHLEDHFVGKDRPSLVIHMDWQSFSRRTLAYQEGSTVELATVEDLLRAGADALMTYLYVGHQDPEREKLEIERNARLARACDRLGMVLIIEPRSAREKYEPNDKIDVEVMSFYCRVSAEIGADIVKCIYPNDPNKMARIINECPAPILVAGGAQKDNLDDALKMASDCIEAGAAGLMFGRNIYQSVDPRATLDAFLNIVHSKGVAPSSG
jgi:DhnA family fructose-bisphosphate aldolase class Ia